MKAYTADAPAGNRAGTQKSRTVFLLPTALGISGMAVIFSIYFVVLGLVQGWGQAVQLLRQDAYLVAPITFSFGVQVWLYTYLRAIIRATSRSNGALTGASGATSTAAMVACCAHRVADLLPFLGLSAAAGFLAAYKVPFMIFGLAVSLAGIAVMLRRIVRYRAIHMREENI
jgi:Cu+-exporting ATPase